MRGKKTAVVVLTAALFFTQIPIVYAADDTFVGTDQLKETQVPEQEIDQSGDLGNLPKEENPVDTEENPVDTEENTGEETGGEWNTETGEESNTETEETKEETEEDLEEIEEIPNQKVFLQYEVQLPNQEISQAADGEAAGSIGQGQGIQGISLKLGTESDPNALSGEIRYRVYSETGGWQEWKTNGEYAGKNENDAFVQAFQAELTGDLAQIYDLYYSVHVQQGGWLGYAKNGQQAGTEGFSYRMEAIRIVLAEKSDEPPGENQGYYVQAYPGNVLSAQVHVQTYGNQQAVGEGELIGTEGQSKRIEGLSFKLEIPEGQFYPDGGIRYRTHVQGIGWQDWMEDGTLSGTTGQSLRIEAIQIELTGEIAKYYDVYYTAHIQQFGWLGYAKNGQSAGSEALGFRMEALKVFLVEKSGEAPGNNSSYYVKGCAQSNLKYSGHVQKKGNIKEVGNNTVLGTVGEGLRLEGIRIRIDNASVAGENGGIQYRGHVQNIGWQNWVKDGQLAGTSGQGLRMEAIQIQLTGVLSKYYDVYYRVHVQQFGWLGWAKNGQSAGTTGYGYRMEAIQIFFQAKTSAGPANSGYYKEYVPRKNLNVEIAYQYPEFPNGCEAISLYMALRYNGYMVSKQDVCYKYMPRGPLHSTNPYLAYMGDPGSQTGGYGCWASVICTTAENYFKAANITSRKAKNVTGSSLEQLFSYIDRGIPVVVWGTLGMDGTTWFKAGSSGGATYYWASRAHCVLLTGYDKTRKVVKVNDPIEGKVEYSFSSFESSYNTMNKNAMVIE
nr:C39 family peptidase [uncultured Sellimonas sp.]